MIGVVGDAKYESLRSPAPPTVYLSISQNELKGKPAYTAVVRVDGPTAPLAGAARSIMAACAGCSCAGDDYDG